MAHTSKELLMRTDHMADNFIFKKTEIEDVIVVETTYFGDERGYFAETYNEKTFKEAGLNYRFVQDNQSHSKKGVLRGLHFQKKYPQAKLMRVLDGEIFDVAVDIRKDSPTFGKWVGELLSSDNKRQLLIPRGFAHGFLVLSDYATICYKCDDFYHPEDEGGIMWNDQDIGIEWPVVEKIILSEKDKKHPSLKSLKDE